MKFLWRLRKWIFLVYAISLLAWMVSIPHDPNLVIENPANQLRTLSFQSVRDVPPVTEAPRTEGVHRKLEKSWSLAHIVMPNSKIKAVISNRGTIFMTDKTGTVLGLSPEGNVLWKFKPYSTDPDTELYLQIAGGCLYLLSENGTIYKLNPSDGTPVASTHLGPQISGPMVPLNDRLVVPIYDPAYHASYLSLVDPVNLQVNSTGLWIPRPIHNIFATPERGVFWLEGDNVSMLYDMKNNEISGDYQWPLNTHFLTFISGENSAIFFDVGHVFKVLIGSHVEVWRKPYFLPTSVSVVSRTSNQIVLDCRLDYACTLDLKDGEEARVNNGSDGKTLAISDDYVLISNLDGHIEFWTAQ